MIVLRAALDQRVGRTPDIGSDYPRYWERLETPHGLLSYSLSPHQDDRICISVGHWTADYPPRAEAERAHDRWARSDARVPFVAWDVDDARIPEHLRNWRIAWANHEFTDLERRLAWKSSSEAGSNR